MIETPPKTNERLCVCNRVELGHHWDKTKHCRLCWLFYHDPSYNALWGGDGKIVPLKTLSTPSTAKVKKPPEEGPGTELKNLLKSIGIEASPSCACNKRMNDMNVWGVEVCKEKRQEIVGWLQEERDKRGWGAVLSAAVLGVSQGLWLNPFDLLGSLVDEAIKRAEKKG